MLFSEKSYWTQNVCFDYIYNFCLKHFSLPHKICDFWKKIYWTQNVFLLSLQLLFETFLIISLPHKTCDFREKSYWTQNVYFDYLYNFCLKHFSLSYYLINVAIFGKKLLNAKGVFWLSLQLLFETFLIISRSKKNSLRYHQKCSVVFT